MTDPNLTGGPSLALRPIGIVRSPLVDAAAAPKQGDEGAPDAWLDLEPSVAPAAAGLVAGDRVLLLTWLDRADRSVLTTRPRDDPAQPERGVFTTRSPHRPNPIGLHEVQILAVEGTRILVDHLEALHGTPILDIKPVLGPPGTRNGPAAPAR